MSNLENANAKSAEERKRAEMHRTYGIIRISCMIINSYIIIDLYVILYLAYQVLSKQVI